MLGGLRSGLTKEKNIHRFNHKDWAKALDTSSADALAISPARRAAAATPSFSPLRSALAPTGGGDTSTLTPRQQPKFGVNWEAAGVGLLEELPPALAPAPPPVIEVMTPPLALSPREESPAPVLAPKPPTLEVQQRPLAAAPAAAGGGGQGGSSWFSLSLLECCSGGGSASSRAAAKQANEALCFKHHLDNPADNPVIVRGKDSSNVTVLEWPDAHKRDRGRSLPSPGRASRAARNSAVSFSGLDLPGERDDERSEATPPPSPPAAASPASSLMSEFEKMKKEMSDLHFGIQTLDRQRGELRDAIRLDSRRQLLLTSSTALCSRSGRRGLAVDSLGASSPVAPSSPQLKHRDFPLRPAVAPSEEAERLVHEEPRTRRLEPAPAPAEEVVRAVSHHGASAGSAANGERSGLTDERHFQRIIKEFGRDASGRPHPPEKLPFPDVEGAEEYKNREDSSQPTQLLPFPDLHEVPHFGHP